MLSQFCPGARLGEAGNKPIEMGFGRGQAIQVIEIKHALLPHVPLKIWWWQHRVGSIPTLGTNLKFLTTGDSLSSYEYCIATGNVSHAGGEVILQRVRRDFFGEASLEFTAYHCDAVAAQPNEVLRIPLAATRQALDTDPAFRHAWIAHLSRELRRSRAQGERLALKSAHERILHYLESEGTDGVVTLAMSRNAWAAELGLTHESLYRTLARLEAEGQVIRRGPELRLAKHRSLAPSPRGG